MDDFRDKAASRWGYIQSYLFPWMHEELEPCTEALERLIIVLDTIGLEAYVQEPPRYGRGRKSEDRRALAPGFICLILQGASWMIFVTRRRPAGDTFKVTCFLGCTKNLNLVRRLLSG